MDEELVNKLVPNDCSVGELDPEVGAVIMGLDTALNYYKLSKAFRYIMENDCLFIATNTDANARVNGRLKPGAGVGVKALLTSLNKSKESSEAR